MLKKSAQYVGLLCGFSGMLAGYGLLCGSDSLQAADPVTKWEYKIKTGVELAGTEPYAVNLDADAAVTKNLNALGEEGWELVGVTGHASPYFTFKRKK